MSSNIKFGTTMRSFKNKAKEEFNKKKVISGFSVDLSSDNVLNTADLFKSGSADDFIYDLELDSSITSTIAPTIADSKNSKDSKNYAIADSKDYAIADSKDDSDILNYMNDSDIIERDGYLQNVYYADSCDEEWLIYMYMINIVYPNFSSSKDIIDLVSLHISIIMHSGMRAIHHFMFNSKLTDLSGCNWRWLNAHASIGCKLNKRNSIQLLNSDISSINNINNIINNVSDRLSKVNFITCSHIGNSQSHYITYAILSIKLLDAAGIMWLRFPDVCNWNSQLINVLYLYSTLFCEVYIYKFNIVEPCVYVLCKGRKKIQNVQLYKKLIHILANVKSSVVDNKPYNLFRKSMFDDDWMQKIRSIHSSNFVSNSDIINFINSNLDINETRMEV
jgi:hypothetical protein